MKQLLGPVDRLYPMPCVLVVGGTMQQADTLAVAWINIVSSTPATIAMGLRRTRRTLELIRESGEFTVNVPDTSMAAAVDYCGTTPGRERDKFADAGLTLIDSAVVKTPIIAECAFNVECRVTQEVAVGEYVVVLGEVVEAHAEEHVLRAGTNLVEMDALDPLIYCAGVREYRALGAKVADAYQVGRQVKDGLADE
ncbi:MAG: flavin reductase family protein [Coriobacteriia bacterium]|nr:flavin reductase family protein [Coriobacteriia bacterium]